MNSRRERAKPDEAPRRASIVTRESAIVVKVLPLSPPRHGDRDLRELQERGPLHRRRVLPRGPRLRVEIVLRHEDSGAGRREGEDVKNNRNWSQIARAVTDVIARAFDLQGFAAVVRRRAISDGSATAIPPRSGQASTAMRRSPSGRGGVLVYRL